jgi:integral membrane protein
VERWLPPTVPLPIRDGVTRSAPALRGPPPTIGSVARTLVRLFLVVATLEALSWLGLLAGMYVKYLTDGGELGVKIFGPVHGGVFVAYVLLTLLVARLQGWSVWVTLLGLACSVPPFATLAFEAWTVRTGRLAWPGTARSRGVTAQPIDFR